MYPAEPNPLCTQAYADALSKKGFLRLRATGSGTSYVFAVGKVAQAGRLIRPLTFSLRCANLRHLRVLSAIPGSRPAATASCSLHRGR